MRKCSINAKAAPNGLHVASEDDQTIRHTFMPGDILTIESEGVLGSGHPYQVFYVLVDGHRYLLYRSEISELSALEQLALAADD